jgi:diguanylate cyclase (GGDEF)-like protein/PAS domain S-box-containing protein
MRVIDAPARLIKHGRMYVAKDEQVVRTLSRQVLEQMVKSSSDGILLADAQEPGLPIVYANPAYEDLTGYSAEELAGTHWNLPARPADGQPELERLKAAIGRSEPCQVTVPDLRKDGSPWISQVSIEPLYNARGDLQFFLCLQRSVPRDARSESSVEVGLLQRELGRARQKIANLDRIDAATGLLRFGYFNELLRRDLAVARREQRSVTLLLFEIVEFQAYRETFGSKAADSCQRMIGAQVTRTLRRAGDLCARYDESRLVASVLDSEPEEVQRLAEQIAENVRKLGLHNPRAKSERYVTVRTTVVACVPGVDYDAEPAIARARAQLSNVTPISSSRTATR